MRELFRKEQAMRGNLEKDGLLHCVRNDGSRGVFELKFIDISMLIESFECSKVKRIQPKCMREYKGL